MENETFFWDGLTKAARELAESLFAEHRIPSRRITRKHFPLIEQHLIQCIVVYDVGEEGRFSQKDFWRENVIAVVILLRVFSKNLVVTETSYQMLETFM